MTMTVNMRDVVEQVIAAVTEDGSGEVFAEDVETIMRGLNLRQALYPKVASTLEEICRNRVIATAFVDDPHWAYAKYVYSSGDTRHGGSVGSAEYFENFYTNEAEQGIALLLGLSALS